MTHGEAQDLGQVLPGEEKIVIASPAELVASVPAILGFVPGGNSLVVVCGQRRDGGNGPVIRLDIPELLGVDPERGCSRTRAEQVVDGGVAQFLADFCSRDEVVSVYLIVVHSGSTCDSHARERVVEAVDGLIYWLHLVGTKVSAAFAVDSIGTGHPWLDLETGERGIQCDPKATSAAAAYALEGRVCHESRDDIDALYQVRDSDAVEEEVVIKVGRRRRVRDITNGIALHERIAKRLAFSDTTDDSDLAQAGAVLRNNDVRDGLLSHLAELPPTAEDGRRKLWWAIARRRPASERSAALTLLGASAYFEGGGVHAASALTEACLADPENRLAQLLLFAIRTGLNPESLRKAAQ